MMKKKTLLLAAVPLACAAALALFLLPQPVSKTESFTLNVPAGMSLHLDTTLRRGAVAFSVTDDTGVVLYSEENLTHSYKYAIESFRDADYTVDITYDEAVARVQVYLTDAQGKRVNGES